VYFRATAVWGLILLFAVVNGAARQGLLIPHLGETAGRALSTVLLSLLVLASTWFTSTWIGLDHHPPGRR
jgi:hypothetical protein